jgi:hypothetical protein
MAQGFSPVGHFHVQWIFQEHVIHAGKGSYGDKYKKMEILAKPSSEIY